MDLICRWILCKMDVDEVVQSQMAAVNQGLNLVAFSG
jgi:hypothetical protein